MLISNIYFDFRKKKIFEATNITCNVIIGLDAQTWPKIFLAWFWLFMISTLYKFEDFLQVFFCYLCNNNN